MTTNILDLWKFPLRVGKSDDPRNGACLLDAISWLEYGTLGDHPACVCPVFAAFGRRANDIMSNDSRQRLRVFIPRFVGTVDPASERKRAEFLAWQAIRVFAPLALDVTGLAVHAHILRVFRGTLQNAKDEANAIASATYAAADAGYASVAAADAAKHAADACSVVLSAAYAADAASAAYAADAASDAYAADAASFAADAAAGAIHFGTIISIEDAIISALEGVIRIGRRAEPILEPRFSAAVRSFELARSEAS